MAGARRACAGALRAGGGVMRAARACDGALRGGGDVTRAARACGGVMLARRPAALAAFRAPGSGPGGGVPRPVGSPRQRCSGADRMLAKH
jgi:hypothetical protein